MPYKPIRLNIYAASSLTDAFGDLMGDFATENFSPRLNFAASGVLQKQIENGAPADVFASAAVEEMDALQRANLIEAATRVVFARNRLVLIVPKSTKTSVINDWRDLAKAEARRVALADWNTVPAGRYAKSTLMRRGVWRVVERKATRAQNVRQALAYVATGDAAAGIVFATDAHTARARVRVVATAQSEIDHAPILYTAAVLRDARNRETAERFVRFLISPKARRVLRTYGFAAP